MALWRDSVHFIVPLFHPYDGRLWCACCPPLQASRLAAQRRDAFTHGSALQPVLERSPPGQTQMLLFSRHVHATLCQAGACGVSVGSFSNWLNGRDTHTPCVLKASGGRACGRSAVPTCVPRSPAPHCVPHRADVQFFVMRLRARSCDSLVFIAERAEPIFARDIAAASSVHDPSPHGRMPPSPPATTATACNQPSAPHFSHRLARRPGRGMRRTRAGRRRYDGGDEDDFQGLLWGRPWCTFLPSARRCPHVRRTPPALCTERAVAELRAPTPAARPC